MYDTKLHLQMYALRDSFTPALNISEIVSFVSHEMSDQKAVDEAWQYKNAPVAKLPSTKKEIKAEISYINERMEWWLVFKRSHKSKMDQVYAEVAIEKLLEQKVEYKKRLTYSTQKLDEEPKERAKLVPITNFVKFNGGFARCLWHNEKTGSLKYYPDNHVYCFSCQKRGDTIDVVMALEGLDFKNAVKFILQ